ncbi:MAG: D-alanyl-D-alanine carboxypeptidase, partial [Rhodospirillales bacterium]|nr:D-alanyl-D-alanine carboxypeptidase [Rhodospirillales bacterium]
MGFGIEKGGNGLRSLRRKLIVLALAVMAGVFTVSPAFAKYAALIMDAETGRVLHQVNADTRNYPASLTKMMTLYLVFEALDQGRITYDTRWKVSARAARQPSSKLGLKRGETITVKNAILALVTKSANDVASVIADALGGGERDFALKMTAMARQIGMSSTTFRNSSGLPHRAQMSTARDMAILARRLLIDYPKYYHFFSTSAFTYKEQTYRNHNKLLETYSGTDGIKTGYIRASGFNLTASAQRDGKRLIGVIFGGRTSSLRNRHMARLLDKGFEKLKDPSPAMAEINPPAPAGANNQKPAQTKSANADPAPVKQATTAKEIWGIQVGVYANKMPALEIARTAIEKATKYLADGTIKIVPLKRRNKKPLYRARILGIEKKEAYRACRLLEKRKISCMELRLKE